ncbi:MAG: hypothetical protein ABWY05_08375 [Noviherbaspirillum sp.]
MPENLRNEKAFDILDLGRNREPSLAQQLGAAPAYGEHSGVIMAVTQDEVIQRIGRGKQVVWTDLLPIEGAHVTIPISWSEPKRGYQPSRNLLPSAP